MGLSSLTCWCGCSGKICLARARRSASMRTFPSPWQPGPPLFSCIPHLSWTVGCAYCPAGRCVLPLSAAYGGGHIGCMCSWRLVADWCQSGLGVAALPGRLWAHARVRRRKKVGDVAAAPRPIPGHWCPITAQGAWADRCGVVRRGDRQGLSSFQISLCARPGSCAALRLHCTRELCPGGAWTRRHA